jgi:hypothetical protein
LPIYVIGIVLVGGYFADLHTNPLIEIILWLIAIGLFLTGHKIEGNLRAMTLIILYKYLKSKKVILRKMPYNHFLHTSQNMRLKDGSR